MFDIVLFDVEGGYDMEVGLWLIGEILYKDGLGFVIIFIVVFVNGYGEGIGF